MDLGIYSSSYFDYDDDEIALQREMDMMDDVKGNYEDKNFPCDGRSLYFDPLNPPRGAIPGESIRWCSISEGDVLRCEFPVTFVDNQSSAVIDQGALGDTYFVNALRLLACQTKYLKRLMLSDRFSSQGCYTWKFCKAGKWRYVHIDDRIPCRQSGNVNFCRNSNPNETFAMLIEKAYAKLHGCYEALTYGLIEKAIHDLTPSAHCGVTYVEKLSAETAVDVIWAQLETAMSQDKLVGCGRWIEDPYSENAVDRKGITLGRMYQVADVCAVTAPATAELDSLTVGMVCVRILQKSAGRYLGRWSYGDRLWVEYPTIGEELHARTEQLRTKLGLRSANNSARNTEIKGASRISAVVSGIKKDVEEADPRNEADSLDVMQQGHKASRIQPSAPELFWIQIEEFAEVFNRIYSVTDVTIQDTLGERRRLTNAKKSGLSLGNRPASAAPKALQKRYFSRWIPGDFIGGAAGPPVQRVPLDSVSGGAKKPQPSTVPDPTLSSGAVFTATEALILNPKFNDSPMYPFSVSEDTTITISLYQEDRRWSVDRLGRGPPQEVITKVYAHRQDRLVTCMQYPLAIGFVVLRLFGLKMRVTDIKLKKFIACSDHLEYSNVVSTTLDLHPGRYCVIPYTNTPLNNPKDYALVCSYFHGCADFEVSDLLTERPTDDIVSEDETETEADNDEERDEFDDGAGSVNENDGDETSVGSAVSKMKPLRDDIEGKYPIPKLLNRPVWEYLEDTETLSIPAIFDEVGHVSRYVNALSKEVKSVDASLKKVVEQLTAYEAERTGLNQVVTKSTKNLILGAAARTLK